MKKHLSAVFAATLAVASICLALAPQHLLASGPDSDQTATPSKAGASVGQSTGYALAQVAYLGPEGTYTQEACGRFFGNEGTYVPYPTVGDAVQALLDGACDYAVIPQENTIGGPVTEYLDEVVYREDLWIVGEVELPISQNLLAQPGTNLADVEVVYSHKQGLAQGGAWLAENLPDAQTVEVSSTAEGARMVAQSPTANCAAIGSTGAAQVYGLEVAAGNIQGNDSNKTRFYVLSCEGAPTETSDRLVFTASGSAGDLPALLAAVDNQGMRVAYLHARPEKTELGRYVYLVECSQATYEGYLEVAKVDGFGFCFLGCFPVR